MEALSRINAGIRQMVRWFTATATITLLTAAAAPPDIVFTGACDGSAAAGLDGGGLAVGDDETGSLHVFSLAGGAGRSIDRSAHTAIPHHAGPKYEPDVEAAARVGDRIYWIASHGRNGDAGLQPDRQLFFATTAGPALKPVGKARHDLLTAMFSAPTLAGLKLADLAAEQRAPEAGGINIEALAAGATPDALLIGFRSPRADRRATGPALVIPLRNARQVIDANAKPEFGAPIALNLGDRGLRDMVRKPDGSYVILAGATDDSGNFAVYSWTGPGGPAPVALPVPIGTLHPEAIAVTGSRLVMLSDDGGNRDSTGKKCKKRDDKHARSFIGRVID